MSKEDSNIKCEVALIQPEKHGLFQYIGEGDCNAPVQCSRKKLNWTVCWNHFKYCQIVSTAWFFGDDSLYWIFSTRWQGFEFLEPFTNSRLTKVFCRDHGDFLQIQWIQRMVGWFLYEFSSANFQGNSNEGEYYFGICSEWYTMRFLPEKPKCNDSMNHWSGKLWTKGDTTSFTAFPGKIRSGVSLVYHPIGPVGSYQSHRESSPKASS